MNETSYDNILFLLLIIIRIEGNASEENFQLKWRNNNFLS